MPSGDGRCAATLWQSPPMPRCPLFGLAGLLNEARPIEDGAGRRVRSVGWAGNKTSISKRPIGEFVLGASTTPSIPDAAMSPRCRTPLSHGDLA